MHKKQALRRLASRQHSLLTFAQCRELGVTRAAVRHRLAAGEVELAAPGILRIAGSVPSHHQVLMAAVLDAGPGAVVSHEAAASLWEIPGFAPGSLDVLRRRRASRARPYLGELHETTVLAPSHVTTVDQIPVTTVARTLFDLAGAPGLHPKRVARALDSATSRHPPVLGQLHAMMGELGGRGRPGIALMRELLDERPVGYMPAASGLEARVNELLADAGIATERQVDLGDAGWIGRVDLKVLGAPVVVEADSARHHTSLLDRERDDERDRRLAATGLLVVRITDDEAFQRPWVVAPRVRAAIQAAGGEPVPKLVAPATNLAPSSP